MKLECPNCKSRALNRGVIQCGECGTEWHPIAGDNDNVTGLITAAREVIACWESGDLAAAVRRLSAALEGFPAE